MIRTDESGLSRGGRFAFPKGGTEGKRVGIGPKKYLKTLLQFVLKDLVEENEIAARDELIRKLSASEQRYHALFQYYPIGTVVVDQEGRITEYNLAREKSAPRLPRIGDVMYKDYAGKHQIDMHAELMEVIRSGAAKEFAEVQYEDRLLQVQISPFPGGAIIISMDITESRKSQAERKRLEAQLQQARKMEAIGNLAGGIAHRFNNALAVISAHIDLLDMDLPEDPAVAGHTEPMKDTVRKMTHLTSQLLAYARGGKYQPKIMGLSDFVTETLPLVRHAVRPGVSVRADLPSEIWPVMADFTQMQMVLSAVISNASDATEDGGVIRVSAVNREMTERDLIEYSGLAPGPYIILSIEDNGNGMDEEIRKHIFEPFFTTKAHGRGLGMAAVYGIVKNHAGWTQVESEPGKGTSVHILLPAAKTKIEERKEPELTHAGGTGTVLVIEDDELVMDATKKMVERLGYRVLAATTGAESLKVVSEYQGDIDLAILDIQLPDMHGKDIYPRLMRYRPGLKVIVCSGYSIEGPAQEILNAGAEAFLQKPFSMAALSRVLHHMLGIVEEPASIARVQ
ncbi:MAG: response regulator [Desulfobacteraceae bacterium]|nr:MAG: response regulator [Desulfobacteraceae bacterium]